MMRIKYEKLKQLFSIKREYQSFSLRRFVKEYEPINFGHTVYKVSTC